MKFCFVQIVVITTLVCIVAEDEVEQVRNLFDALRTFNVAPKEILEKVFTKNEIEKINAAFQLFLNSVELRNMTEFIHKTIPESKLKEINDFASKNPDPAKIKGNIDIFENLLPIPDINGMIEALINITSHPKILALRKLTIKFYKYQAKLRGITYVKPKKVRL